VGTPIAFVVHAPANRCYSDPVSLTISIPDEFADVLGSSDEERQRGAREALALELYREGRISLRKMGELAGAGADFWAAENLRVSHGAPPWPVMLRASAWFTGL
jgi:hypothetical protein